MLKLGNMEGERVERLGTLTAHVVERALASGLNRGEAVLAFGIAAKAGRRLKSGMEQSADVLRAWLR